MALLFIGKTVEHKIQLVALLLTHQSIPSNKNVIQFNAASRNFVTWCCPRLSTIFWVWTLFFTCDLFIVVLWIRLYGAAGCIIISTHCLQQLDDTYYIICTDFHLPNIPIDLSYNLPLISHILELEELFFCHFLTLDDYLRLHFPAIAQTRTNHSGTPDRAKAGDQKCPLW